MEPDARFALLVVTIALLLPVLSSAQETGTAASIYCPNLTVTLQFGSRDRTTGGQVTELQRFLSDYYDLNPDDYVTGYFGRLTRQNVRRFQCERMGICSGDESTTGWGVVGSRTRAAIANACSGGSASLPPPPPQGATPPPSPSPAAQNTSLPLVSITINDQEFVELDSRIIYTVRYGSSNASSCALSQSFGTGPASEASVEPNTRGSAQGLVPLEGSVTYTFICKNDKGSSTKSVTAKRKPGAPCTLGGTTLQDRETRTFYAQSSVTSPQTCDSTSRTCNDGILSGSPLYAYASCTVKTATPSPTPSPSPTPTPSPSPTPSPTPGPTASGACTYKGQQFAEGQTITVSTPTGGPQPIYSTLTCDNNVWGNGANICDNGAYLQLVEANNFTCTPPTVEKALLAVSARHGKSPLNITATTASGYGGMICPAYSLAWGDGTMESYAQRSCGDSDHNDLRTHTYSSVGSYTVSYTNAVGHSNSANIRVDP